MVPNIPCNPPLSNPTPEKLKGKVGEKKVGMPLHASASIREKGMGLNQNTNENKTYYAMK